jgi:hypothetical protein
LFQIVDGNLVYQQLIVLKNGNNKQNNNMLSNLNINRTTVFNIIETKSQRLLTIAYFQEVRDNASLSSQSLNS